MRNLKFSFAFILAILAVGVTFASKADILKNKRITACFVDVRLVNDAVLTDFIEPVPYSVANAKDCTQMDQDVILSGLNYKFLLSLTTSATDPSCTPILEKYCCVTFRPVVAGDNAPANLPSINIGGTTSQWIVDEVRCKPAQ